MQYKYGKYGKIKLQARKKLVKETKMQELIPEDLIDQIFNLRLANRVSADGKVSFPFYLREHMGKNTYKILLDAGEHNLTMYDRFFIELKGKVDIEYVRYAGEAKIDVVIGEPDYYKMEVINLYRINKRRYRRVPYKRVLKITSPIECDALLVNISGSGAMFLIPSKLEGDTIVMGLTLFKKSIVLKANIVGQEYDEEEGKYRVRCSFQSISGHNRKLILKAVRDITLKAKERIRRR